MKAVSINDLDPRYQEQVRRQLAGDRVPGKTPDVEHGPRHALEGKKEAPRCNGPVDIRVLQRRHKLCDPEGACFKYVLDSLVDCGVLRSDDAESIREVSFTQEKSETEETIITITPC